MYNAALSLKNVAGIETHLLVQKRALFCIWADGAHMVIFKHAVQNFVKFVSRKKDMLSLLNTNSLIAIMSRTLNAARAGSS